MLAVRNGSQQKGEEVTNKELIDHCNVFWRVSYCGECSYRHICDVFHAKYHDTPYLCDTYYDGKYYTDEEIEE